MTVHQCPKCELKFSWRTEVDDHCRTDHPEFHHEYPVGGAHHDYDAPPEEPRDAIHVPERARFDPGRGRPPEHNW